MVGWISNNDESEYGKELENLVTWCNDDNLSLNVSKIKELIIVFRKKGGEYTPIYINEVEVERDLKKLQKVVCTAQTITEVNLPPMDSTYTGCCHGKVANITKDPSYP
eukprot:g34971.t1